MRLTPENYYSAEANREFMSYSQFKTFRDCQSRALAELNGDYVRAESQALVHGQYLDAAVEGRLDEFIDTHPELISSRGATKGELKAEFKQLDRIVARFQRDPFFMSYLEGDKQVILTGEIAGVPFKGKLDILDVEHKRIVDFKSARDFKSIYDPDLGMRVNFAEFWGYDIQAPIYVELARQAGLGQLDYFIAAVTKESEPDLAVIHVPDKVLAEKLREVEFLTPTYHQLKREPELIELGVLEPKRCEKCDWCKRTKKLTNAIELEELDEY